MRKKLTTAKLLLGLPAETSDLQYASGFRAPDPVVYLQTGRKRYMVVSVLECGRAQRTTCGVHVLCIEELGLPPAKRRSLTEWVAALLKRVDVREVTVHASFPLLIAESLRRRRIKVTPVAGPLFPQRAVKSKAEIACIREVQQSAVIAMRHALRRIQSATVDSSGCLREGNKRLDAETMRHGIDKLLLDRGCVGKDTIVACGRGSADPHERGAGPLRVGEPIVIDIFPKHQEHGYWGDLTRTVVKGQPSKRLAQMYRAVKSAQRAALQTIRPRVQVRSVHKAAQDAFVSRGFHTRAGNGKPEGFIHGTGHGVGLDIHEPPSIAPIPGVLRTGNVVTVEPGLYYPDIGGVRIEDTVLVTTSGWRYLYPCEKHLKL